MSKIISSKHQLILKVLQLSACAVFLGRAWQHLYWDAPFRALLWDEQLLSSLVTSMTEMNWETYITSMEVDQNINSLIKIFGLFYLSCAFIALFIKKLPKYFQFFLLLGALGLITLALLYTKERFYSIGQFFEYSLQFGSPLFLYWYLRNKSTIRVSNNFLFALKIAIALTFTCHGLYAWGYYPIPVQFMEMTMNILGINEDQSRDFLAIAGLLDFITAIGIFLPWKGARFFLLYAIFWGFGTTIARVWANFSWMWVDDVLLQWLHESVMRMPHFLIPLVVLIIGKKNAD